MAEKKQIIFQRDYDNCHLLYKDRPPLCRSRELVAAITPVNQLFVLISLLILIGWDHDGGCESFPVTP